MHKGTTPFINKSLERNRIIGHIEGALDGPTLIFIAGIHGNEPAGIIALRAVLKNIADRKAVFKGSLYAISGNLPALNKGIRYEDKDLNRLWTKENIQKLEQNDFDAETVELKQLKEIYQQITRVIKNEKGPFYFYDLHTTSSNSIPFITVNDSLLNRKYTSQYPLPLILGIEEFLEGALLSYINELGYIAFGFEGGQHNAPAAIDAHIAFINLSIVFSGCMNKVDIPFEKYYLYLLHQTENFQNFFEIYKRYEIRPFEQFEMEPGFNNFQRIVKGMPLARSNGKAIVADQTSHIFMPLYQGKGNDGFFMIRKVPKLFLFLSRLFRNIKLDAVLTFLPGVSWASGDKDELIVNLKVARFFTKKFFHLMGYRNKTFGTTHLLVKNRESASKDSEYKARF